MTGKEILEQIGKLGVDGMKEMGEWVNGAKEFVVEQAPLICQEIIRKGQVYHSVMIGVGVFLFLTYIIYLLKILPFVKGQEKVAPSYNKGLPTFLFCGLPGLIGVGGLILLVVNLYFLLYISLCPRLYVLGELSDIIKGFS